LDFLHTHGEAVHTGTVLVTIILFSLIPSNS
jgi:hypothetical protein